jgi:hypothetical protein
MIVALVGAVFGMLMLRWIPADGYGAGLRLLLAMGAGTVPFTYLAACTVASVRIAGRLREPLLAVVLPWLFMVIHLSWGSGFLVGLLRRPDSGCFAPMPTG